MTGLALCAYAAPVPGVPFPNAPAFTKRLTSAAAPGLAGRLARFCRLRNEVMGVIANHGPPRLLLLEGYSMGSFTGHMLDLAEFGGLLRAALLKYCGAAALREVSPNTLKQFATGKGAGKKEFVMACVAQRYDLIFNSNDECDAFVLARIAAAAVGWCPAGGDAQRKAVDVAMNGKVKQPKPKRGTPAHGAE